MWNKCDTSKEIILGTYLDGTLSGRERKEFEKDLGRSHELFELKTAMERLVSQPSASCYGSVPEKLINKVVDMHRAKPNFAHLTLGLFETAINVLTCSEHLSILRPVAQGIRGAGAQASTIILTKVFETMQLEVEAEKGSGGKGCTVRMSVAPTQLCSGGSKFRVTLSHLERELFSGPLENGQVLFEDMKPGIYSFTIRNSGKIVSEVSLKLVDQTTGGACG